MYKKRICDAILALIVFFLIMLVTSPDLYAKEKTYEVVCPAFSDWCVLVKGDTAIKLTRDQLPEFIPISYEVERCHIEFCVNADMDVIGLNPNYFLWRHR